MGRHARLLLFWRAMARAAAEASAKTRAAKAQAAKTRRAAEHGPTGRTASDTRHQVRVRRAPKRSCSLSPRISPARRWTARCGSSPTPSRRPPICLARSSAAWIKSRREKTALTGPQLGARAARLSLEETIARAPRARPALGLAPDALAWLLLARVRGDRPRAAVGGRRSRPDRCSSSAVTPRRAAERFRAAASRRPRAS